MLANQQLESLSTIPNNLPCLTITYEPTIITHGELITVKLESENKLNKNFYLTLKVISEENDNSLLEKSIKFPQENSISFKIPDDWQVKDYELRIVYQGWILASENLEIVSKEESEREKFFIQGLTIQSKLQHFLNVTKDYSYAVKLQGESAEYFQQSENPLIAARSWEDFAEIYMRQNNMN